MGLNRWVVRMEFELDDFDDESNSVLALIESLSDGVLSEDKLHHISITKKEKELKDVGIKKGY